MATVYLNVKRKKKDGSERWVKIGAVNFDTTELTGAIFINHIDEVWQISPKNKRDKEGIE